MQIYVLKDGAQLGPYRAFELKELLRSGEVAGDDLGWMAGQSEWLPLRGMTALGWIVAEHESASGAARGAVVPGGTGGSLSPEVAVPPARGLEEGVRPGPVEAAPAGRPFTRYAARMIDQALFMTVVAAGARAAGASPIDAFFLVFSMAFLLAWMLVESAMLVMWGTTPGKAILQVRVTAPGGGKPEVGPALKRSLYLLFFGLGLGLFLLREAAYVISAVRLRQTGLTLWDERTGLRVVHGVLGSGRVAVGLAALVACALVFAQLMPPPDEVAARLGEMWDKMPLGGR